MKSKFLLFEEKFQTLPEFVTSGEFVPKGVENNEIDLKKTSLGGIPWGLRHQEDDQSSIKRNHSLESTSFGSGEVAKFSGKSLKLEVWNLSLSC